MMRPRIVPSRPYPLEIITICGAIANALLFLPGTPALNRGLIYARLLVIAPGWFWVFGDILVVIAVMLCSIIAIPKLRWEMLILGSCMWTFQGLLQSQIVSVGLRGLITPSPVASFAIAAACILVSTQRLGVEHE
jgi:hypothetical protein